MRLAATLSLCIVALILLACGGSPMSTSPQAKADAELQANRLRIIERLKDLGVVRSFEPSDGQTAPKLLVTDAFRDLDLSKKKTFCEAIFAYAHELPHDVRGVDLADLRELRLIDVKTGKQIGMYHPSSGGLSLD